MDTSISSIIPYLYTLIEKAVFSYEYWWLKLFAESPQHILIETGLLCFIIWLLFIRKTVDPKRNKPNSQLSKSEIEELIATWQPDDFVPDIPVESDSISSNIMTIERIDGNYMKIKGIKSKVLNLGSFDFLGLSRMESIKETAREALEKYGCGSCGPRGFYGTIDQHLRIEDAVSKFLGTEESIAYSDGASSISSAIPAFSKKGDLLIIDEACSEPILTGAQTRANLSRSTVIFFKHNDMTDLEEILTSIADDDKRFNRDSTEQRRFIVVEGIYRNSGKICPLKDILRLKEKYFYRLILDESISFGTLGKSGRGCTEHFNVSIENIDILMIAMDTALGSIGGICTGSREVIDHQRLSGAGYCFSASAPPFLSACACQALIEIVESPELLVKLQKNSTNLWKGLNKIEDLQVISDIASPVIHLQLKKDHKTSSINNEIIRTISNELIQSGYGVTYSKFSIVDTRKKLKPSLRVCASTELTDKEIKLVIEKIREVTKSVISMK